MRGSALALSLLMTSCVEGRTSCANADYTECGSPLPPTRRDGAPWPSYSEALAEMMTCPPAGTPPSGLLARGECADGKQFLTVAGGFAGETRFYWHGALVGFTYDTDVGGAPCQCPFNGFQGTLASVRCDQPTVETLCDTVRPASFRPGYVPPAGCECDDPPLVE